MKKVLVHNVVIRLEISDNEANNRDRVMDNLALLQTILDTSELECSPVILAGAIDPADIEVI